MFRRKLVSQAIRVFVPALVGLLGGYMFGGLIQAQESLLTNGAFQTGDVSGWSTFTTPNGTLGIGLPEVVQFDVNGDGTPTLSAKFQVGQLSYNPDVYAGGGIYQEVYLLAGDYTVSATAEIASSFEGPGLANSSGGIFELLLDGGVVASYDFGTITAGTTERSTLAASLSLATEGSHELRIRITRPFQPSPYQYLGNVALTADAPSGGADPTATPVPPVEETPEPTATPVPPDEETPEPAATPVPASEDTPGTAEEPDSASELTPRELAALVAGNHLSSYPSESKRFAKAIKEINKSLDPKLWTDDTHLDPKHGGKVFDKQRRAVKELMHLVKKANKITDDALAAAEGGIDDLITVTRFLAATLLDETTGVEADNPKRQDGVDKHLAAAQDELDKGDSLAGAGKYDKAISHYKKAWQHAVNAAKDAAKD